MARTAVASTAAAFVPLGGPDPAATWCRHRAILVAVNTANALMELVSAPVAGTGATALSVLFHLIDLILIQFSRETLNN